MCISLQSKWNSDIKVISKIGIKLKRKVRRCANSFLFSRWRKYWHATGTPSILRNVFSHMFSKVARYWRKQMRWKQGRSPKWVRIYKQKVKVYFFISYAQGMQHSCEWYKNYPHHQPGVKFHKAIKLGCVHSHDIFSILSKMEYAV